MREIRVRLEPNGARSEQARFYIVSLGVPLGAEDALEVQVSFKHPHTNDVYQMRGLENKESPRRFSGGMNLVSNTEVYVAPWHLISQRNV
jgi:hypothetical protein